MKKTTLLIIAILVTVGILGRLLPHLPNATPIAALAFVGSMYFNRKVALLLPLSVLLLTDIMIGFYSLGIMLSVYGSFALIALMSWYLKKNQNPFVLGYMIVAGSVGFFLITNATSWWFSPFYEKSLSGLLYSYELGLPFLRNMLLGDLIYTFSLIGAFAVAPYLKQLVLRNFSSKLITKSG